MGIMSTLWKWLHGLDSSWTYNADGSFSKVYPLCKCRRKYYEIFIGPHPIASIDLGSGPIHFEPLPCACENDDRQHNKQNSKASNKQASATVVSVKPDDCAFKVNVGMVFVFIRLGVIYELTQ